MKLELQMSLNLETFLRNIHLDKLESFLVDKNAK